MNTKLLKTAFRNISRNRRRSILSGMAIGVAAMTIVLMFSLIAGMSTDMANNLINYYTGEVRVKNARFEEFERYNPMHLTVNQEKVENALAGMEEIESFVPRTTFPSSLYIGGSNFGAVGIGADFDREDAYMDFKSSLKEGRLPVNGEKEMIMGAVLARDLNLKIGDKVTVMSTTAARGTNAITLKIVGLFALPVGELNAKFFWIPLDTAQYFLRMDGEVLEVLIKMKEGYDAKDFAAKLGEELKNGSGTEYDVRSWDQISTTYGFLKLADMIYNVMAFIFFILGSTVIINTTMMVIYERMREIGTLGALGMHGSELTRLFFLEGTIISIIGTSIGVVLGIGIVLYLSRVGIDFTDAMSGLDFEISSYLYPQLKAGRTIFVFFYSVVVASLATLIPSRKAARIQPVEALRYI
ncbi:ABC transporter permease [Spirochaeta isovalerica]|uniref:Putative ABC transport system permease protein n=1 Tax=Spirochaeta isovalerica TaxID=150 RepID=A0A841RGV2_9SPIO|nr:FtsX-like permease family protein [Spirochaeta isovalerica]MBB6482611.1 putative ABC transport system permease protein [Spirochaeta isovalerica]